MKKIILLFLVLVIIPLAFSWYASLGFTPRKIVFNFSTDIEQIINDTTIFRTVKKKKYLLVNFWETWCKPCIKELPELNEIKKSNNGSDIEFWGVTQSNAIKIEEFMTKNKFDFKIVRNKVLSKYLSDIANQYDAEIHYQAVPLTMLLDLDNNKIIYTIQGYSNDSLAKLNILLKNRGKE